MVEYSVILKRYPGSTLPDVCIIRDEDRDVALREMHKYCKQNGFSVQDDTGRHTVANIILEEKEPIAGAPVKSVRQYCELFDD